MRGDKEKIAFHKGALTTLIAERRELVRILTTVNGLMMAHIKSLKDMGINLRKEASIVITRR